MRSLLGMLAALLVGRRLAWVLFSTAVVVGLALAATALGGLALVVGLLVLVGGGRALFEVSVRVLLQRAVRPEQLARVFGVAEGLDMLGLAAGSVLVPLLVALGGPRVALVGTALVLPAVVLAGARLLMRIDEHARVPVVEIALLRQLPLFGVLPGEELEGLADALEAVHVPEGTTLMAEGEPGDYDYAAPPRKCSRSHGPRFPNCIRSLRPNRRRATWKFSGNWKTGSQKSPGFAAVSLQPNAGSQGEFAGLLAIREYHASRGEAHRNVCLIPTSAHGTNPASAIMAGFKVVSVACLKDGDIDLADLRAKADEHARDLAALMVTYPSTHGVFEPTIREICDIVHAHRRPGLHGRRKLECAGRSLSPRRLRRRCLPFEFAQNVLYPARRRRTGCRTDRRRQASRALLAPERCQPRTSNIEHRTSRRSGRCSALGQRQHSDDHVDVHSDDGRRRD